MSSALCLAPNVGTKTKDNKYIYLNMYVSTCRMNFHNTTTTITPTNELGKTFAVIDHILASKVFQKALEKVYVSSTRGLIHALVLAPCIFLLMMIMWRLITRGCHVSCCGLGCGVCSCAPVCVTRKRISPVLDTSMKGTLILPPMNVETRKEEMV